MRIVFLDRDGTLIREAPDELVDSFDKLFYIPGVFDALKMLRDAGYEFVMVTNQDHLGTAVLPNEKFFPVHNAVIDTFKREGIEFREVFICPHVPEDNCDCRKPRTGLVKEFLVTHPVSLSESWMVGDRETDVEFGKEIGVRTVRIGRDVITSADILTDSIEGAAKKILQSDRAIS